MITLTVLAMIISMAIIVAGIIIIASGGLMTFAIVDLFVAIAIIYVLVTIPRLFRRD